MAEHLGAGVSFPLRVAPGGGLSISHDSLTIEESIRVILGTTPGQRAMRPEFGCSMWDLVFEPVDPSTLARICESVSTALSRWEPRIDVESVEAAPDEGEHRGQVVVSIRYVVRSTNDFRNLVYPFYEIPGD